MRYKVIYQDMHKGRKGRLKREKKKQTISQTDVNNIVSDHVITLLSILKLPRSLSRLLPWHTRPSYQGSCLFFQQHLIYGLLSHPPLASLGSSQHWPPFCSSNTISPFLPLCLYGHPKHFSTIYPMTDKLILLYWVSIQTCQLSVRLAPLLYLKWHHGVTY